MELFEPDRIDDEPPPFLERWPKVYIAVLIYLGLLILVLYVITRIFEPSHV
ncbi:MAG TPA: hypothetical protein VFA65_00505 [Bryobacteraceae bacterium]|nr:hypothetical protein [Bryobacteraceae bacterium]